MRIAVLADIHGNLGALDAVLADIELRHVDLTVNLGDTVSGPLQPSETADRLMPLEFPTVSGNHERQLLTLDRERMGASDLFAAARLKPDHWNWLIFPRIAKPAEGVYLCHGTPDNDVDYLLETLDESGCRPASRIEVMERLAGCPSSLILCGHTHLPRCVQLADGRTVLNPGCVGLQAYHANWPQPHVIESGSPLARYAIAEESAKAWLIEWIQVEYDWEAAARLAEANGRPDWAKALRTGTA
ncbi:MAG TPA: metallophosphoesterase family protein [Terracidiphilus sp.]|jgi:predicted phosphodiesterase|nr:metallophosphoesterase family protein [Terracidiphilus sp.]